MKSVILDGDYGTRLLQLTLTQPKPLVKFANKPMILHQIEALSSVGVNTVILAILHKREQLENEIIEHTDESVFFFSHYYRCIINAYFNIVICFNQSAFHILKFYVHCI